MIVIGIDNNLFDNDFGVDHEYLERMLTRGCWKSGIEPTNVVEHLIASWLRTTVNEAAQ